MSDNQKIIIGIILSFIIILFGPALLKKYLIIQTDSTENNISTNINTDLNNNSNNNINTNNKQYPEPSLVNYKNNIILKNDYIKIKIANNIITECESKKYILKNQSNILLNAPIKVNFITNNIAAPTYNHDWHIIEQTSTTSTIMYQDIINNVQYKIKYLLDDLYGLQINTEIINKSLETLQLGSNITMPYLSTETPISCSKKIISDQIENTSIHSIDWIAKNSLYWINLLYKPKSNINHTEPKSTNYELSAQIKNLNITTSGDLQNLITDQTYQNNLKLLILPKSLNVLSKYEKETPLLEKTIDFGWLYFITKPILIILQKINTIINDYGISIIILTFLIQLSMLYFNYKGHVSMQKIKLIQPELDKINQQYANDAITKSNKTFEVYGRENISIFAQILPLILQLPLFYSIFKVIGFSIELHCSPSLGIIEDLTFKDTTNVLFFIPHIPLKLGIFPILTGISFFLQSITNPQSNNMEFMQYLPIIMIVVAQTTFPTGLMLYLITNNILTALRQFLMHKYIKIETTKAFSKTK